MKNETIFPQIFPQGDRLPEEFSRYFRDSREIGLKL